MRIKIAYRTTYRYQFAATGIVQALRLRPADHDGQHIRDWRVDVDVDGVMRPGRDAFGNRLDIFYADGAATELTISVTGEADTVDTAGVVRGGTETLPPSVYLRTTELTAPCPVIIDLAESTRCSDPLASLHRLMARIHEDISFDSTATDVATVASDALTTGRGVCQDFAHIFATAARHFGVPTRYVSGHLARAHDDQQDAGHAWAESWLDELGWVAFDPANGIAATEAYLRVAIGLDYLDAAPVRGARRGGGAESLSVSLEAVDAMRQGQN